MPDMSENSAILARIDERTQGLVVNMTTHLKDDTDRFDKVLNFVSKKFDKIDEQFNSVDKKLDALWDDKNQRQGAFSAGRLMTACMWAIIVLMASYFMPRHGV